MNEVYFLYFFLLYFLVSFSFFVFLGGNFFIFFLFGGLRFSACLYVATWSEATVSCSMLFIFLFFILKGRNAWFHSICYLILSVRVLILNIELNIIEVYNLFYFIPFSPPADLILIRDIQVILFTFYFHSIVHFNFILKA